MDYGVDAVQRLAEHRTRVLQGEIAHRLLDRKPRRWIARNSANIPAALQQRRCEPAADIAAGAGDQGRAQGPK